MYFGKYLAKNDKHLAKNDQHLAKNGKHLAKNGKRSRGSDDDHAKLARPPTKFTHPGKNKCVSSPSLQTYRYYI